jgi:hypothetical protein
MRIPVRNDRLCQGKTDPGQPGELSSRSRVSVHPLASTERPGLTLGTVTLR